MTERPAPAGEPAPWRLTRALRRYADILARLDAQPWEVTIDGEDASGEYLLVEVLNMRAVGPNLALAPDANPSDGLLDVVLVGEEQRAMLIGCLDDLRAGREVGVALPRRRARQIEIQCPCEVHVDDQIVREQTPALLSLSIDAGALIALDMRK
jgi:diacylglycerol kinase family enzyme